MSLKDYKRTPGRASGRQFNVLELADASGMPLWSNAHRRMMHPDKAKRISINSPKGQAIIKSLEQRRLLRTSKPSKPKPYDHT